LRLKPKKSHTIKKSSEFKLVLDGGIKSVASSIVLFTKSNTADVARFGLIVSKKNGPAVARNRIKRRLRSALRAVFLEKALNNIDIVIIARKAALEIKFSKLIEEILYCLRKTNNI
jgi:ribonuclease P protein component